MTEFQSRRELREAERQGLVPKPEQVFDLPTGQIKLPQDSNLESATEANTEPEMSGVAEMLTRKRIREMERQGLLDPLTGSVAISAVNSQPSDTEARVEFAAHTPTQRVYDEVLAETEEPITASINAVIAPTPVIEPDSVIAPASLITPEVQTPRVIPEPPIAPTDIFHSMAVDVNARRPRVGIFVGVIVLVLAALGIAAYTLGLLK